MSVSVGVGVGGASGGCVEMAKRGGGWWRVCEIGRRPVPVRDQTSLSVTEIGLARVEWVCHSGVCVALYRKRRAWDCERWRWSVCDVDVGCARAPVCGVASVLRAA